jgi:hypothetical protein
LLYWARHIPGSIENFYSGNVFGSQGRPVAQWTTITGDVSFERKKVRQFGQIVDRSAGRQGGGSADPGSVDR